jgi:hypothetical protein
MSHINKLHGCTVKVKIYNTPMSRLLSVYIYQTTRCNQKSTNPSSSVNSGMSLNYLTYYQSQEGPYCMVLLITVMGWYLTKRSMHCDHLLIHCAPNLSYNHSLFIHQSFLAITAETSCSEARRNREMSR